MSRFIVETYGSVYYISSGGFVSWSPPQRLPPSASPPRRGHALLIVRAKLVPPTGQVLGRDIVGAIPHAGGEALPPLTAQVLLAPPIVGLLERKQRRERGPNWGLQEILALVVVKREEFLNKQKSDRCT
jgi:hypothetical protein